MYLKTHPKISIIVPSYNQGNYLEETLVSIISQNYTNMELIVIDGESTDNSVEIIKRYENRIAYWVSEKDNGQADAINKGLSKATGDWVSWLNSDDCYMPHALEYIFNEVDYDQYDFLYGNGFIGTEMIFAQENRYSAKSKRELKDILKFFYHESHIIPSQSVFIRKRVINAIGLLNEDLHYCMDLDWFCRIYLYTQKRFFYEKAICFYRINDTTKTSTGSNRMKHEAITIAEKYSIYLNVTERRELAHLIAYYKILLQYMERSKKDFLSLLYIALRFPFRAIYHITFKTLLRQILQ